MYFSIWLTALYFIIGCFTGKFLNAIVDCLLAEKPLQKCFVCTACTQKRSLWCIAPLFGWFMCEYYSEKEKLRYPLVKFLTGVLFMVCGFTYLPGINLLLVFMFTACLVVHTCTDLKEQLLFDNVSVVMMMGGVVYAYYAYADLWQSLYGALLAAALMYAVYRLSGGMGFGDVKLAFVLGIWLGVEYIISCLLLAFIAGGAVGCFLLLFGNKGRRDQMPFGPYLCWSAFAFLLWGSKIMYFYWNLLS